MIFGRKTKDALCWPCTAQRGRSTVLTYPSGWLSVLCVTMRLFCVQESKLFDIISKNMRISGGKGIRRGFLSVEEPQRRARLTVLVRQPGKSLEKSRSIL